ncbi:MAG TPA: putative baseplate assembly protein [Patescibacteria group bacterium]|nr:putative baseplate assembly protein [Patescibacteria group bacterium]
MTPLPTANRPGLPALSYRIGTHATFLESMKARLSSSEYPQLAALTTRETDDPAIALLDAWATVADVLTFYQERVANEGYLRTATERRSVLELARLVGYQPRPGVASSVYLAYTLDDNFKDETVIPKGARSQSVPGPGELPQSFEISEELKARAKWNNLKPRMTQPQTKESIRSGDGKNARIYLKGISTNLKPNDPLLIDFLGNDRPEFFRVKEVAPDVAADRTLVTLQAEASKAPPLPVSPTLGLIESLTLPPSVQLANSLRLERNLKDVFLGSGIEQDVPGLSLASTATSVPPSVLLRKTLAGGEASHAALKAFAPVLRETLATAAENAEVTVKNPIRVYALRVKASFFGHNAPDTPNYIKDDSGMIKVESYVSPVLNSVWRGLTKLDGMPIVAADIQMDHATKGSWLIIDRPTFEDSEDLNVSFGRSVTIHEVQNNQIVTMAAQGVPSKISQLTIDEPWLKKLEQEEETKGINVRSLLAFSTTLLRNTIIYAQSEELGLAEEPIGEIVCGGTDQLIELDGFYEGLESGRWVIVSGERKIEGTSGVRVSELAMLSTITQDVQLRQNSSGTTGTAPPPTPLAGDKTHSFVKLANKLEYCFKRDTVTIYGNVVKATHGETRREVLGSGDGAKALQSFVLKQPPLTYVSASNPSGVDSTLRVYVNDIQWRETDSLAGLSPTDRNFITKTDDDGKTTVVFGNGREGAQLPTGIENIKAESRNGIGKSGNVKAGQITLLTTRPLGVKEVVNPLRASGGADKESRDQARKNAPVAVMALDRLVSVQDYEDFARTYAGIGKARAVELSDGRRQLVHLTIAGADDIPIDKNSDLYRNLRQALRDFGDPYQAIQLEIRELMLIVISARIRILPEYQWEPVVTHVRTTLLDSFGFERRELGQDVLLSEVISVIQSVRGVAYVDVDVLRGIPERIPDAQNQGQRRLLTPEEIAERVSGPLRDENGHVLNLKEPLVRITVNVANREVGTILPAQLAFLTPDVPETLILNQIT